MGRDLINTPYTSHKKTPIVNATAHNNETSLVSFVFQAFITCGRRATVVNVPAAKPIISTWIILNIQISNFLSMPLYKFSPGFYFVPHQDCKYFVSLNSVF